MLRRCTHLNTTDYSGDIRASLAEDTCILKTRLAPLNVIPRYVSQYVPLLNRHFETFNIETVCLVCLEGTVISFKKLRHATLGCQSSKVK